MNNREKIKQFCIQHVKTAGLTDDQAADLFMKAAEQARTCKTAVGVLATLLGGGALATGGLAASLIVPPIVSGNIGYAVGQGIRNAQTGVAPSIDELKKTDEIAAYKRNIAEIYKRVIEKKLKAEEEQKKSVRRMF